MPDAICYAIRPLFFESPLLTICPHCQGALLGREINPTRGGERFQESATIPLLETRLYECRACDWWAVRETRIDCELDDGATDYLLVPLERQSDELTFAPWEQLVDETSCWAASRPMTLEEAIFIFGESEVSNKTI